MTSNLNFRICLNGCEPVPLVGLALVRGQEFTLPSHGNFLALLGGLDEVRLRSLIITSPPRRASPSECVYMENFRPSYVRSWVVNGEASYWWAGPPLM